MVNGVDVGLRTSSSAGSRRTTSAAREDFDIDEELADISRYYAKRTLIAANNDEELTQTDESKVYNNNRTATQEIIKLLQPTN